MAIVMISIVIAPQYRTLGQRNKRMLTIILIISARPVCQVQLCFLLRKLSSHNFLSVCVVLGVKLVLVVVSWRRSISVFLVSLMVC